MGMFDYVRCEAALPDDRAAGEPDFQTKSLWCSMDQFTITAAGRLIYHKRRYSTASNTHSLEPIHVADIDMDYHGDLEMHGTTRDDDFVRYVVRFTHGTVEWIRPFEELPDIHWQWLMERER